MMAAPELDKLIAHGSRVDLVHSKIGMVVRAGEPKPDISTKAAFEKTLLAAKSIGQQKVTIFSAGVAKGSKETEAGQQLIKFLTSKSVYPMIEKNGLEPAALAVAASKK